MNEKNITSLLIKLFGKVFTEENIFTNTCISQYEYLIDKYELNEKQKQILYYILNIEYPVKNKNAKFDLIITMYNEVKINRCIELLLSLSKNLQNNHIQNIHIIYETQKNNDNINFITEILYILKTYLKLNISMKYTYERPSFRYLFKYCNECINGIAIISNTDIIYDNTLKKIERLEYDEFLCISRYNKRLMNDVVLWEPIVLTIPEHLPQNIQNSFSHDTWIFQSPMKYPVYIDMLIGKMFCDSYLNYKLSLSPYKCYNLANDVYCYHIQEDNSFSDIVSRNTELLEEYADEIKYKENGNTEFLYALIVQSIEDFYNKTNFNVFYSHSDFVAKYILVDDEDVERGDDEDVDRGDDEDVDRGDDEDVDRGDDEDVERSTPNYISDDNSFLNSFEEGYSDSDDDLL